MNTQPKPVRQAYAWKRKAEQLYAEQVAFEFDPFYEHDPDYAMVDECWNVVKILDGLYNALYDVHNAPECTCTPRDVMQCDAHPVADPSAPLPY